MNPLDASRPDVRVEFGMAEAEFAQRAQWQASAYVLRAIDETLRETEAHPQAMLEESSFRGRDAVELAARAATSDLAVRLSLAESTVRAHAHTARMLRERTPSVWAWFCEGDISTANAHETAALATELPAEVWAAFDVAVLDAAKSLAPARFRSTARALRERLHTEALVERRERAIATRVVYTEVDRDGMGWLHAKLPVETLAKVTARLDADAFALFRADDEIRTMHQLRADVLDDLLVGSGTGSRVGVTVALTVPVLSLLGASDEPATLEGVGPIDLETARRLAAEAPSFTRLLTDPISGGILDMDARQYRPTAALKRWLAVRDVTCTFPGCGRRASACDLDHITAWAEGGRTRADNLAHLCRSHHTLKHETKWRVERTRAGDTAVGSTWTSPTRHTRAADPPPF